MQTSYEVWMLRADGIVEQPTDKDGLTIRYDNQDKANDFAKEIADRDDVQEVYLNEMRTVRTIPGKMLKDITVGQCPKCKGQLEEPIVQLEFECPELRQKPPDSLKNDPEGLKIWNDQMKALGQQPSTKTLMVGDKDHPFYRCPTCLPDLAQAIRMLRAEIDPTVGMFNWAHVVVIFASGKRSDPILKPRITG